VALSGWVVCLVWHLTLIAGARQSVSAYLEKQEEKEARGAAPAPVFLKATSFLRERS